MGYEIFLQFGRAAGEDFVKERNIAYFPSFKETFPKCFLQVNHANSHYS